MKEYFFLLCNYVIKLVFIYELFEILLDKIKHPKNEVPMWHGC